MRRFGIPVAGGHTSAPPPAVRQLLPVLLLASLLPAGVRAAEPDSAAAARPHAHRAQRTAGRPVLSYGLTLARQHDDNVLQLTRSNLDLFASRPGPPRFEISDVGDWSTDLDASLQARLSWLRRRETRLAGELSARRYDRDRIADWQSYGVSLDQELTVAQRRLVTAGLWWEWIPDYYLGEITDLDESVSAGSRVRQGLTYAQSRYGVSLDHHLHGDRLTVSGSLERVHRQYNRHFAERDNDNDQFRISGEWQPLRRWPARVRVSWLRGDLNAAGDLPDALGVPDRDISYDHDGWGTSLTLPWTGRVLRGRLDVSYMPEARRYTTDDKFDVNRFRRTNKRREVNVRLTERVRGPLDVQLAWSRLESRAFYEVASLVDPASTNFAQEQFRVSLRWRGALLRR